MPLYYQGHVYRAGSRLRVTLAAPRGDQPVWRFGELQPAQPRVRIGVARALAAVAADPAGRPRDRRADAAAAVSGPARPAMPALRGLMGAPLESWQVGPWNRWAYQHVDEMVPTVVVPRGVGPVLELPEQPQALDLGDFLDTQDVDGLAVLHEGALVLESYRNDMRADTLHLSQSVGKSVLGLLAGALHGRGALDPAALVTDLVPEVAGSGYDGALVQHLLDMTAAIDFVEDYATFWRYDVACAWHPPHPDAPAETILDYLPTIGPAAWAHGERLHYSTPNTDLLGLVTERAVGAPLAELIARELGRRSVPSATPC